MAGGIAFPIAAIATPGVAAAAAASGGNYVPVNPTRITDTRANSGQANAGSTLAAGGSINISAGPNVPSGSAAIAVTLTAVDGTQSGFLSAFPTGGTLPPLESVLNYRPGPENCTALDCVVPNLVVVQISASGQFTVYNGGNGSVNVVADLDGYFTSAPMSGGDGYYFPLSPSRLADTRCGDNPPAAGSNCSHEPIPSNNQTLATMTGGQTTQVNVAGDGGVPSSGAEAAVLQFTVTNTTANGYLTAWASGASTPNSSNVNWVIGQTTSNRAIVPIGANGRINVFNFNGSTDVIIDVVGYFSLSSGVPSGGSLFTPVTPSRIYDSRPNSGQTGAGTTLAGNSSINVQVTGNGGIPGSASTPTLPTAVMANVTEADATQAGFVSVTPTTLTPPASTSDVNFVGGEIRANADIATLNPGGALSVYNYVGNTDVVLDVFGYFAAAPSGAGTVVNVAPTSGPPGQTVIGNVNSPASVTSLTVGGCGITSQVLNFNVNTGAFTFNIPATQPPGPCVLTFTSVVNGGNVVTQVNFTVTNAAPTNAVSFSPPSVTLQANGTSTQVFTITVSAGGTPVGSDGVTLSAVNPASTPGSCGTLNPTSGTTSAAGTITTTYTSSTTAGFCTLTATEGGQHAIGGATVVQTIGPPPATKNTVALTAVPNAIAANGTSTSTINATVTGPGGVLVGGDQVAFIIVAGTAASCGSVGANPVSTTGGNGVASITYTSSTQAGTCIIEATELQSGGTGSATVTQGSVSTVITITADPSSLLVSPVLSNNSAIQVTVNGVGGVPVKGDAINLTETGSGLLTGCGTLTPLTGVTDSNGQLNAIYTGPLLSLVSSCTITATDVSNPALPAASVTIQELLNVT